LGLSVLGCAREDLDAGLGQIDFPTSARGEAQSHFLRGVLFLHSFEYASAADEFRAAQVVDPDFGMAYWGEAMTFNHPVWDEQDIPAARSALDRLAPDEAQRGAKTPTEREKAYLQAVEILYGEGTKEQRDTLYSDAMGRLVAAFPNDPEARAFYALSLLGLSQGNRDVSTYMRAGAVAQEVFDRNREHPGAAHYIIHSFDDPVHAPLGLTAARAYAEIAPGAAHAQHMTSHIFVAMGMWDDVVTANERAASVVNASLQDSYECGHYNEWLEYGYLQQGRFNDAARLLNSCLDDAGRQDIARSPQASYAYIRALNIVDTEQWDGDTAAQTLDQVEMLPRTRYLMAFGNGYAAAQRGDVETARTQLRLMETLSANGNDSGNDLIMQSLVRALILRQEGQTAAALNELEQASDLEETLPFAFGPPATAKPPRELLGDMLLDSNRTDEAFVAYARALARTPRRAQTLLGAVRAASKIGRTGYAADRYAELQEIWRDADLGVRSLIGSPPVAAAASGGGP
jgi:tetratricopeptide (TPR) repeat protein